MGQPVSSIVDRHTDSNSQGQAARQAANRSSQSELKVQLVVISQIAADTVVYTNMQHTDGVF